MLCVGAGQNSTNACFDNLRVVAPTAHQAKSRHSLKNIMGTGALENTLITSNSIALQKWAVGGGRGKRALDNLLLKLRSAVIQKALSTNGTHFRHLRGTYVTHAVLLQILLSTKNQCFYSKN